MKTAEQQYEVYSNYMRINHANEFHNREWIITDIEEYYEDNDFTREVKDGELFVLDQYAGDTDTITHHKTFEDAWNKLIEWDSKNVKKALEQ